MLRVSVTPVPDEMPFIAIFRELGWGCARVAWCHHYSKLPTLKPEYISHKTFFDAIDYFYVSCMFKSVKIHLKRSTTVYRLCVCPLQSERVVQRGGLHASDGHHIEFDFNCTGYTGKWSNRCFDEECVKKLQNISGTIRGEVTPRLQQQANTAFASL